MENGITIKINVPKGIERLIPKVAEFLEKFSGTLPQDDNQPGKEIMSPDDVCKEFKINKTKLYSLTMQTGKNSIPRFKIGRDLRFKRSELVKWFNSKKIK